MDEFTEFKLSDRTWDVLSNSLIKPDPTAFLPTDAVRCGRLSDIDIMLRFGKRNNTYLLDSELPPETGRPSLFINPEESIRLPQKYPSTATKQTNLPDVPEFYEESSIYIHSDIHGIIEGIPDLQDSKIGTHLVNFQNGCELIECDLFNTKEVTDETYSMCVEANFLASKIADNSILDISQEGGTILDKTPQPEFVEDDSANLEEKKVDTEEIYKQLDKMLPPSESSKADANCSEQSKNNSRHLSKISQISDISRENEKHDIHLFLEQHELRSGNEVAQILTMLQKQVENTKIQDILECAIKNILDLSDVDHCSNNKTDNVDGNDSGHSSSDIDKINKSGALDLSMKKSSSLTASEKKSKPKRLSITFSHHNDPALPSEEPTNKLKQQTIYMKKIFDTTQKSPNYSNHASNASAQSNDSKYSNGGSSSNSVIGKLKPRKVTTESSAKGPLKAIVPLSSLNTSYTIQSERPTQSQLIMKTKQTTPKHVPRPMAQSTPEEFTSKLNEKRPAPFPSSPLARPNSASRATMSRLRRFAEIKPTGVLKNDNAMISNNVIKPKTMTRQHSAETLPRSGIVKSKLRRCNTVGGKENSLSDVKFTYNSTSNLSSQIKPPANRKTLKFV